MLDPQWSRKRQQRLFDELSMFGFDALVVGHPRHVYYFSGFRTHWLQQSALVILADGSSTLVCANEPAKGVAADRTIAYEAQWHSTQRLEQPMLVAGAVSRIFGRNVRRVGIDASAVSSQLSLMVQTQYMPIDPNIDQLRRIKDPDELALMKKAIECTAAMYDRARQVIAPGIDEIDVFAELHSAAVKVAGEPLSAYLGNDYRPGPAGGPPKGGSKAQAGQLYILDLGPCYRGYFADNARTFSVDRKPTDAQLQACEKIIAAHGVIQRIAKPGVKCRDIWAAMEDHYQSSFGKGQSHHLGHGVGLEPHEFPHLNPKWDDTLMEGEIFTAEPGVYSAELNGGIRIENQYRVTAQGVECLVETPLSLV